MEKPGDTSLTWSTVQLFPCLAAVLGLHLCPLAKEGEPDMTCRAAPESKAGRLEKTGDSGHSMKPSHIQATGSSQGIGALSCSEHKGTEHCLAPHTPLLASQCLPEVPNR